MKQQIAIPYLENANANMDFFTKKLNHGAKHSINNNPWNYDFSGKANFTIAYADAGILINFNVIEENVLARFTKANDPVYKDSCVEFFIALNNEKNYYNFEFNCTGTCLAGYGASAENRSLLPTSKIELIDVSSSFKSIIFNQQEMVNWQLTMLIPNEVFHFHKIDNFKGYEASLNFYKCGDDLPKPHYLCWNPIINSLVPNFHLPNHFGKAIFLKN